MTDLPDGWEWSTLGEVCEKPQYGWTSKSGMGATGLRYLRTTDITKGPVDWERVPRCEEDPPDPAKFILAENDIVISRAGSVGESALVRLPPPAVFASYLIRLRAVHPIRPAYLAYYLRTPQYWRAISDAKVGIAVQNVNAKKLAALPVPVAPAAEQVRIVAAIEEYVSRLDCAAGSLDRVEARAEQLVAAARATIDRQDWPRRPLREVAHSQLGKMLSAKSKTGVGSTPYLRNRNVRWGSVDVSEVAEMDFSASEREKFRLLTGDVLICEGGAGVGRTAIWRDELEECCYQKALHRVRTGDELLSEFLAEYLRHFVESRQLDAHLSGVAIGHFPQEDLRALAIPVPDVSDQRQWLQQFQARAALVNHARTVVAQSRRRSGALRRSILAAAFSGRLVAQDPDDEPAADLLHRIGSEREQKVTSP
jgi:type I restriction enzyme S subunit